MESTVVARQSQTLGVARLFVAAALVWLGLSLPASAETVRLVAFGDSLTAGFRLEKSQAFPAVHFW